MPTSLRITSRLHVIPLFAIQQPHFEKLYRDGVYWSLFKERCTSPLSDRYMLENVRESLRGTDVDEQHAYCLPTIGFHFGRLHGAILSPQTGQPRQNMTVLACFVMPSARRGYDVGRQWYFIDSLLESPDERRHTDDRLVERLQELECESLYFHEEESMWYYALGCILGDLSDPLFPATSEEYAQWEAQNRRVLAEEQARRHTHDTGPLEPVTVVEYTV